MARKRKLMADLPDTAEEAQETESSKGKMGGMWAGSAMNMLRQRIEDTHGSLQAGILNGTVALELDPGQITDQSGSDRLTDWQADEDFQQLVANIKRRGQTQPIRVRPSMPDWAPSEDKPLETKDEFVIQSGRRRLEACRQLGRKVLAIVSTDQGDQALADLEERFHENTMRRNLSGFEELLSIGLLAESLTELSQTEIASRLGVAQGDVSLGLACVQYRKQIMEQVDIAETPKRAFRSIIPKIKKGEPLQKPEPLLPPALTGDYTQRYDVRGVPMSSKPVKGGFQVQIKKAAVAEKDLEKMLVEMAKLVMKYQVKKPD